MIDWRTVILTLVWVLGLAILLAGWSYSRWSRHPTSPKVTWLGLLLTIAGLLAIRLFG